MYSSFAQYCFEVKKKLLDLFHKTPIKGLTEFCNDSNSSSLTKLFFLYLYALHTRKSSGSFAIFEAWIFNYRERERESIINWLTDFRCLNHVSLSVCILCVDHTHANSQEYTKRALSLFDCLLWGSTAVWGRYIGVQFVWSTFDNWISMYVY